MQKLPESGLITWVNHYSVLNCMDADIQLSKFDVVGVDGVLLRLISRLGLKHSSADYSFPAWLEGKSINVGLIGGDLESSILHRASFSEKFPRVNVLWSIPGDDSCVESVFLEIERQSKIPKLILVGMGAPNQERRAIELMTRINIQFSGTELLVATCGGWLDQIGVVDYYPRWSTPLRLNWLVRLYREPGRLWRRYLVYPIFAIARRKSIVAYLGDVKQFLG